LDPVSFYRIQQIPVQSCLMVGDRDAAISFPRGDLELVFDPKTGLIQNRLFQRELLRYTTEYEETQGFSPRFRRFQTELCKSQVAKYDLSGKTVLEIGCGKGEFLVELCEIGGCRGIGIDPSYRPERTPRSAASRIEFVQDLYSEKYSHLRADYVCCRHTLEHIFDVEDFVRTVRKALDGREDVVVFFELPAMERILEERAFWDIYYEHCSYFTAGSLARLFRRCGFELFDLYHGFDGQYLMLEARPGDPHAGPRFPAEQDLVRTSQEVEGFRVDVGRRIASLRADLNGYVAAGLRPVVWGSGSKAVSYLSALGITHEVEWIVDVNPHKQGKFLAGSGHEIVGPEFLRNYRPGVVIVMNPIYVGEIRDQLGSMGLSPRIVAV